VVVLDLALQRARPSALGATPSRSRTSQTASISASVADQADPKDQAILAAALTQECRYLVTLNERDFWPPADRIAVVRPGDLLHALRDVIVTTEVPESE